jgi:hypothetical protein
MNAALVEIKVEEIGTILSGRVKGEPIVFV